jgi:hypothetical protein
MDGIFEELDRIENVLPSMPPFEALRLYFAQPLEVCPTAMMDRYHLFLMEAEQASREYHVLPFDGGLWDQPLTLLRAFSIIRSERNQYERIRMEKVTKKMKRQSSDMGNTPNVPAFRSTGDAPPMGKNLDG